MTNKQKSGIAGPLSLFWIFWLLTKQAEIKDIFPFINDGIGMLVAIIFSGILVNLLIVSILPSKKKKKKPSTQKKDTIQKNSNSRKSLSERDLLTADIESLSGEDFERLLYLYFKDKGFKPQRTPKTGDHGVDLVITDPKDGYKIAVQCKRYTDKNIGNDPIIKLDGGRRFYGCHGSMCITTSNYTKKAKEFAEKCKVELWNGLHVQDKLSNWKKQKAKNIS